MKRKSSLARSFSLRHATLSDWLRNVHKTATSETVWNDNPGQTDGEGTGGGYSTVFPVQSFQIGAPPAPSGTKYGTGRMVPDVAGDADPLTGYEVYVHGSMTVVGGTSAVAPLYAGLFASFGTKLGFVTPKLWQNQGAFTDITQGSNGLYNAAKGPDPCSGIGSPKGHDPCPCAPKPQNPKTPKPLLLEIILSLWKVTS